MSTRLLQPLHSLTTHHYMTSCDYASFPFSLQDLVSFSLWLNTTKYWCEQKRKKDQIITWFKQLLFTVKILQEEGKKEFP